MRRAPKKQKRTTSQALVAPTGLVVCPDCFSRPSINARDEKVVSGHRGWGAEMSTVEDEAAVTHRYPCSNPECLVDIEVTCLISGLGTIEGYRKGMPRRMMSPAQRARFIAGVISKEGVWRSTAPPKQRKKG